jgi:hypothetical protein
MADRQEKFNRDIKEFKQTITDQFKTKIIEEAEKLMKKEVFYILFLNRIIKYRKILPIKYTN